MKSDLRSLPAVDVLLKTEEINGLIEKYGDLLTKNSIRDVLNGLRKNYRITQTIPDSEEIIGLINSDILTKTSSTLFPLINATGVVLHTNLGRSPLCLSAIQEMKKVAESYSTLEFDIKSGKRGKREIHAEMILREITGAEAAYVVNNNASAVLLILSAMARRRKVVISRTQLVEIGGGFRIPEVMKQSGAKLIEVGTTNRVNLNDYQNSISENPAMFLRAHHSNFKIIGFTHEPEISEIIQLAHRNEIPVVDDLGSGALVATEKYGLGHEPTVQESISAGVDIVSFSGDKLIGGPQAGIIVGKKKYIDKIRKHPFARAVRPDKICLAALSATLFHYLRGDHEEQIPIWMMISQSLEQIKKRAEEWKKRLDQGIVKKGESKIGGGSLPEDTLPTYLLALNIKRGERFLSRIRELDPPIIARIEKGEVLFDPRTVFPEQDDLFINNLAEVLENGKEVN